MNTDEDEDNEDYIRDGFVVDEDEEEKDRRLKKRLATQGDLVDSEGTHEWVVVKFSCIDLSFLVLNCFASLSLVLITTVPT